LIGEIALSKGNNAGQILAVDDVKFTLDKLVIRLRFSKTDQTGKGVSIEIPKITGSTICPFKERVNAALSICLHTYHSKYLAKLILTYLK
jgi:hypothetical protein